MGAATRPELGNKTSSKNKNKNTSINVPFSIIPFYLQSRHNCLEFKTSSRLHTNTQWLSQKKNHDCTPLSNSVREKSQKRNHDGLHLSKSLKLQGKKRARKFQLSIAETMAKEIQLNHQR